MPQFHMHLGPSFRHTSSSWTFSLSNAGASSQWKTTTMLELGAIVCVCVRACVWCVFQSYGNTTTESGPTGGSPNAPSWSTHVRNHHDTTIKQYVCMMFGSAKCCTFKHKKNTATTNPNCIYVLVVYSHGSGESARLYEFALRKRGCLYSF